MHVRPSVCYSKLTVSLLYVIQLADHCVQVLQEPDVPRGRRGMTRLLDGNQFLRVRIVGGVHRRGCCCSGCGFRAIIAAAAVAAQVHSGEEIGEHGRSGCQDVLVYQKFPEDLKTIRSIRSGAV